MWVSASRNGMEYGTLCYRVYVLAIVRVLLMHHFPLVAFIDFTLEQHFNRVHGSNQSNQVKINCIQSTVRFLIGAGAGKNVPPLLPQSKTAHLSKRSVQTTRTAEEATTKTSSGTREATPTGQAAAKGSQWFTRDRTQVRMEEAEFHCCGSGEVL